MADSVRERYSKGRDGKGAHCKSYGGREKLHLLGAKCEQHKIRYKNQDKILKMIEIAGETEFCAYV